MVCSCGLTAIFKWLLHTYRAQRSKIERVFLRQERMFVEQGSRNQPREWRFNSGRKLTVFGRKKISLSLTVQSYNLHTLYFKYLTTNLAQKRAFKDLIIVALQKIWRPILACFRLYLLHRYRAQCSKIERVFQDKNASKWDKPNIVC